MNQAKSTKQQVQHSLGPRFLDSNWTCVLSQKKKKKRTHTCITGYWKIGGSLKQPDIACMKVGYDNRNSSYIEAYVFVVWYMLTLIFFFLENLTHKSKLTNLSLFLTIGEASFEINVWKSISVCGDDWWVHRLIMIAKFDSTFKIWKLFWILFFWVLFYSFSTQAHYQSQPYKLNNFCCAIMPNIVVLVPKPTQAYAAVLYDMICLC